jgi:hypothetical protein
MPAMRKCERLIEFFETCMEAAYADAFDPCRRGLGAPERARSPRSRMGAVPGNESRKCAYPLRRWQRRKPFSVRTAARARRSALHASRAADASMSPACRPRRTTWVLGSCAIRAVRTSSATRTTPSWRRSDRAKSDATTSCVGPPHASCGRSRAAPPESRISSAAATAVRDRSRARMATALHAARDQLAAPIATSSGCRRSKDCHSIRFPTRLRKCSASRSWSTPATTSCAQRP